MDLFITKTNFKQFFIFGWTIPLKVFYMIRYLKLPNFSFTISQISFFRCTICGPLLCQMVSLTLCCQFKACVFVLWQVDVMDKVSLWTPLMRVSAISGNAAAASILLQAGADVNVRDKAGKTPLMVFIIKTATKIVEDKMDDIIGVFGYNFSGRCAE